MRSWQLILNADTSRSGLHAIVMSAHQQLRSRSLAAQKPRTMDLHDSFGFTGKSICTQKSSSALHVVCRDPDIIPFYHSGMARVMPEHGRVPRVGQTVAVTVGDPIDVSDLTCNCSEGSTEVQHLPILCSSYASMQAWWPCAHECRLTQLLACQKRIGPQA